MEITDSEKEMFLILHGWRILKHGKYYAYFPPESDYGTYDLGRAYESLTLLIEGKINRIRL
jgi:hypothetical protein